MKAKWIDPKFRKKRKYRYPRCSSNRESVYWRDIKGRVYRCTRPAIVIIDERNYCYQHGGAIALRSLVSKSYSI